MEKYVQDIRLKQWCELIEAANRNGRQHIHCFGMQLCAFIFRFGEYSYVFRRCFVPCHVLYCLSEQSGIKSFKESIISGAF